MNTYDYIIVGAGAAGLSLIVHMIDSGKFSNKTILLIDRSPKTQNDRTWCFWELNPGLFEPVIYKSWSNMWFHGIDGISKLHSIAPYEYKMIRSIDFYNFCFEVINKQTNIVVRYGRVEDVFSDESAAFVIVEGEKFYASFVFNSMLDKNLLQGRYFLWQHFKGWLIETQKDLFKAEEATLMDFRIKQENDTRFVYVMPFSKKSALIEYTVFSEKNLSEGEYHESLERYCQSTLGIRQSEFTILEEEFGMIPMTNHAFPSSHHKIIYIGSAGGQTKASSGYTFRFIQKHSRQIVHELIKHNSPHVKVTGKKFSFYDSILLKILSERKLPGALIFSQLFQQNEMRKVFKFLDNETSIGEDLKLINTLPRTKFISAAISHFLH
jgi:lycopene beta-cyclase